MNPGRLRHHIIIESPTSTQSPSGARTQPTWDTYVTRSASIQGIHGSEQWKAAQMNPLLTHNIVVRWAKGLGPGMRVRYDDPIEKRTRYFAIESIIAVDERPDEQHLVCVEKVKAD